MTFRRIDSDIEKRIKANPKYHELVARRARLSWGLVIPLCLLYLGYQLAVVWAPGVLGAPIAEGMVTTIGIPVVFVIIGVLMAATGVYVWRANTCYDRLIAEIIEDLHS